MISDEIKAQIKAVYAKLLVHITRQRVAKSHTNLKYAPRVNSADLRYLMSWSARLALGVDFDTEEERAQWQNIAFDIATRIVGLTPESSTWHIAADLVLSRLGNFPGRKLLRSIYSITDARYPSVLGIEAISRELENTVRVDANNDITLTDFQLRFYDALNGRHSVSISAPTSAGKSFVLGVDIIRRLLSGKTTAVVYLVPTRALIRQVMRDIIQHLQHFGLYETEVVSAPIPPKREQAQAGIIYVLTQERLMSLLYSDEGEPLITTLIVDEAQELGDDDRGMMLHSAITRTIDMFPNADVVFSSPLASNPGFLLSEFRLLHSGEFFVEHRSPVSQLLILLSAVPKKPRLVKLDILGPSGPCEVCTIELEFKFRGSSDRLARSAYAFTLPGETSIVYANGASEAESLATELASLVPLPDELDSDVVDLIEFVRAQVHPQYKLIECLRARVAFHYGDMPHLIRSRIEDLAREGKIPFVCCTSTLLQGVNLPAKNIFIQSPSRGRGKPMSSGDFWNLAGRVGRLKNSFNGNVWCLDVSGWETDPTKGPRLTPLSSSFKDAIEDDNNFQGIINMINNPDFPSERAETRIGEQAFGKIFAEYTLQRRRLAESTLADPALNERLDILDRLCGDVETNIDVSKEVCLRNSTISPWRLEALRVFFSKTRDLQTRMPMDPRHHGAMDRTRDIFETLENVFFQVGNDSYRYYAALAFYWMRGRPLSEIISNRLRFYNVSNDPDEINKHIRNLFNILERTLHYRYVKYLRAYNDVLALVLRTRGYADLADKLVPLYLYIELGASDPVLIGLMSIGLTRTTAILLRQALPWPDNINRRDCMLRLRQISINKIDIPEMCRREIEELIGGSTVVPSPSGPQTLR